MFYTHKWQQITATLFTRKSALPNVIKQWKDDVWIFINSHKQSRFWARNIWDKTKAFWSDTQIRPYLDILIWRWGDCSIFCCLWPYVKGLGEIVVYIRDGWGVGGGVGGMVVGVIGGEVEGEGWAVIRKVLGKRGWEVMEGEEGRERREGWIGAEGTWSDKMGARSWENGNVMRYTSKMIFRPQEIEYEKGRFFTCEVKVFSPKTSTGKRHSSIFIRHPPAPKPSPNSAHPLLTPHPSETKPPSKNSSRDTDFSFLHQVHDTA